jgi:hypothetical protein
MGDDSIRMAFRIAYGDDVGRWQEFTGSIRPPGPINADGTMDVEVVDVQDFREGWARRFCLL